MARDGPYTFWYKAQIVEIRHWAPPKHLTVEHDYGEVDEDEEATKDDEGGDDGTPVLTLGKMSAAAIEALSVAELKEHRSLHIS